jgi:hypothetical protein
MYDANEIEIEFLHTWNFLLQSMSSLSPSIAPSDHHGLNVKKGMTAGWTALIDVRGADV